MKKKAAGQSLRQFNKQQSVERWIKAAPRSVAVVVFYDNAMRVAIPEIPDGVTIHEDHPVFRATLSATIHGDDHKDLAEQLAQRLGAVKLADAMH